MSDAWETIARRAIDGLGVQAGELILVRDRAGHPGLLEEMLLAVEHRGATPLPELVSSPYLHRLLTSTPVSLLQSWDRHKLDWMRKVDRIVVLEGTRPDLGSVPPESMAAWQLAAGRLSAVDDERRLPFMLVAVPNAGRAESLGVTLADLEAILGPALAVSAENLRAEIARARALVHGAQTLTIRSGDGFELHLALGGRTWLDDAGSIQPEDRERGAHVANLPAGSIYTTVMEGETRGSLHLGLEHVTLRFELGAVVEVTGGPIAQEIRSLLDRHDDNARRISHVGLGLNPALRRPIGWTLVDEHVHGCLFIALGENRYLGGENESDLNIDYAIPGATLLAGDRLIVDSGTIMPSPG